MTKADYQAAMAQLRCGIPLLVGEVSDGREFDTASALWCSEAGGGRGYLGDQSAIS